jgi:hypothetical protein
VETISEVEKTGWAVPLRATQTKAAEFPGFDAALLQPSHRTLTSDGDSRDGPIIGDI